MNWDQTIDREKGIGTTGLSTLRPEDLYTLKDLRGKTGISLKTWREYIRTKRLKAYWFARKYWVPPDELERFIRGQVGTKGRPTEPLSGDEIVNIFEFGNPEGQDRDLDKGKGSRPFNPGFW